MLAHLVNQRGSSLIQVMVGVAVMGIVIAGFTTFMDTGNREAKSLQQKLEILQTQQDLMRDLSDPALCACNFNSTINTANAANLFFDTTNPNSKITLPNLFTTCVGGTPGNPLIAVGENLPGSQGGLRVGSIEMKEFVATGTGRYRAKIEVGFAADSLKMGRKPASVNVSVVADLANPTQARVTSCTAGKDIMGSGGGLGTVCPATTINPYMPHPLLPSYVIPEAPVGTFFYNAFAAPGAVVGKLSAVQPDCTAAFFGQIHICNYTTSSPQTLAWQTFNLYCPGPENGGP